MTDTSRRTLLKRAGGGAATLLAIGGGMTYLSEPSVAATGLTADDVSVTSSNGTLTTLEIEPSITVSWSNQNTNVATVKVTWYVKTSSTSETTVGQTPYSLSVSNPSQDGSISKQMGPISLLSNNGGALSASNFAAGTDGGTKTTDVTISMDATLQDSNGNQLANTTDLLGPTTFAVSVTNESTESASVSGFGTANTFGA
ncbi:twin-arginine translocation signal domain-containing protein [Halobacterium salinarum]|jgi:hypothetical protein|uniref:twin-arginine translocation signal domain-containing protein n=1 Tax=Halobacterium salinarum TaxID=2242 RepID=UPI002556A15B|nr:twin-arginine translocation signal domain-containing protein [Halobacterium salinarum]MDL0125607.1 twin-arginine translocation signal domain-containing protein [Halobacterium salinarum]